MASDWIVGLGQGAAGDDGVGFAVLEALRADPPAALVALVALGDPAGLLDLLDGRRLMVVDAVVGLPVGEVATLDPAALGARRAVSSHGLGLVEVLGLAEAMHGPGAVAAVTVLGVGIARPDRLATGLSAEVAAAVGPAVALARAWAAGADGPVTGPRSR